MRRRFLSSQSRNPAHAKFRRTNSAAASAKHSLFSNRRLPPERSEPTAWPPGTPSAKIPTSPGYLSLAAMEEIAREGAGANHHFRFVQLAVEPGHARRRCCAPNQIVQRKTMAMVQAARALGITLITSAALLQGQLSRNLPAYVGEILGTEERFGQRVAIRKIRAGGHHRARGDEPRRARPRQPRHDRRRTRSARSVPENVRAARLASRRYRRHEPRANCSADFVQMPGEKMVRALDDHQPLRLAERGK